MNQEAIENVIREILKGMNNGAAGAAVQSSPTSQPLSATTADYPIAQKHPDWIRSESGKSFDDITLSNVLSGQIQASDLRITPRILKAQGDIAASAGRSTITNNLSTPSSLRCIHPIQNRALTPREGARIQSFPDTFHFIGNKENINSQIGNAVPPLLAMAIAQKLTSFFDNF